MSDFHLKSDAPNSWSEQAFLKKEEYLVASYFNSYIY